MASLSHLHCLKPDSMQHGLVCKIKCFKQKRFHLADVKFLWALRTPKQHYIHWKDRPFFPRLAKYRNSGSILAMVWEGPNAMKTGRVILGETNPVDSKPRAICGNFCIQVGWCIIHGNGSVKGAEKEIKLRCKPKEPADYRSCAFNWAYE
ncbi:Nucleoside diphosphate kinase B [Saguinus oedipus]|uniref:nucleoside-diphosphate kinase n=1 Tax=Saguinus oedipus TaxID=9490 RepID=A0ABQ9WFH1_SAGOE|nr:Nucleoside diphosphate kinase B [Saguinus oedipus]